VLSSGDRRAAQCAHSARAGKTGEGPGLERERGSLGRPGERLRTGPRWIVIFLFIQKFSKAWIDSIKRDLSHAKKIQIKYGFEAFEISNNFTYRNFSKFGIEFKLKIKESSMCWIWMKFDSIWLEH
jgi:hypothetical protein